MARRKRRAFTPEFKAEAVRLTQLGERSIAHVATDLDLTETALREWVKRAEADAGRGRMSRTGDCWDNAVAESFFATLKAELVDHQHYRTRDEAIASIGDYIERFYNPRRRHSHLGYKSPIEFELRAHVAAIAA